MREFESRLAEIERALANIPVRVPMAPPSAGESEAILADLKMPFQGSVTTVSETVAVVTVGNHRGGVQVFSDIITIGVNDPNNRHLRQIYKSVSESLNCSGGSIFYVYYQILADFGGDSESHSAALTYSTANPVNSASGVSWNSPSYPDNVIREVRWPIGVAYYVAPSWRWQQVQYGNIFVHMSTWGAALETD